MILSIGDGVRASYSSSRAVRSDPRPQSGIIRVYRPSGNKVSLWFWPRAAFMGFLNYLNTHGCDAWVCVLRIS